MFVLSPKLLMLIIICIFFFGSAEAQMGLEESHFVKSEYTKKISMDLKDASLIDVLKIFSKQSGKNFIAGEGAVGKKITLFIENISVEEALEKILEANDLTYEMKEGSDIFVVKPIAKTEDTLMTWVFPLVHATVPSSKLNSTIELKAGASSSGSPGGIVAAVKGVMSKAGVLVEDARTNSLIITDKPERFTIIKETIAKLDVQVPQILIEVEMLDVSKGTTDKMGLKLGSESASFLTFEGASKETYLPFNQSQLLRKLDGPDQPQYEVGTISASGMTAALDFIRSQRDTKNLARPRILTLNNETAEIKISTDEAIGITKSTDTAASSAPETETAERVQTGVFLTVTPQANVETNEIIMAVYPKVIQATQSAEFNQFKDPEERGTQSILRVKNGETIIIGGLMRTNDSNRIQKVPFLGDIPLLGGAFRHKEKTGSTRELIIFITPHILDENNKYLLKKGVPVVQNAAKDISLRTDEIQRALSSMEQKRF
jgi:type II secretory pathway component GspD/PulD (secretin)